MSKGDNLDPLRPRRPGGMGRGAMFAIGVHVVLLIAIAFGVSWRSSEPTGATAELWAAVPEVAAPPAAPPPPAPKPEPKPEPKVEPPPPPPKPEVNEAEIAIEKAKVEKARREREEQEREAKEKAEAQKKQRELAEKQEREKAEKLEREKAEKLAKAAEKAAAERAEAQRKANIDRMMGQTGATGAPQSTGTAQRDAGPSASYAGRIVARVRPNIVLTETVPGTLRAEVEVRAAPDGTIVGRRLVRPSGNSAWDEAVLRALDRTEVLPKDTDGRVPSPMLLVFTPT